MDDRLVFDLVWEIGIHPAHVHRKRKYADDLHEAICELHLEGVKEQYLCGMMEVLQYMSERLLAKYGASTRWRKREDVDKYYPLRVRALDLVRIGPVLSNT